MPLVRSLLGLSGLVSYIARRILGSLPVLFMIVLVSFLMIRAIPGGPFVASGQRAQTKEVIAAMKKYYGLDRPLLLNLPGSSLDWSLLHYVDEPVSERVEIVSLKPKMREVLQMLADTFRVIEAPPNNVRLMDQVTRRIILYDEQGVTRAEIPTLLSDLTAIKGINPDTTIAEQITNAIALYTNVDTATLPVTPTIRTTTRSVLYSDLFQSQFGNYLFNLLRLDFGPSLGVTNRGRPVGEIIASKLPISMALGVMAVATAIITGIPLGVLAAVNHNRPTDHIAMFFAVVGRAVPNIVIGPVLIIVFAVQLKLFPVVDPYAWIAGPQANPGHYFLTAFLPVVTLAMGMAAGIARLTRASLLQVLNQDYIRTARAKGLHERSIIYGHGLRNSLIPVVTILGPLLAAVLTGTFVVELVFAIPGLGDTFVTSVTTRDYNLLVGVTVLYSVFLVGANILVDVLYTSLDPRIQFRN
ncbi:MAG: ABC transporter permease [Anaerolineae bacterium]|nr:ABC transporter permease [Anaerolineae bacterium]